ncbi:14080_t:CDS:2 [Funneliformis geosporum]|nr:14080_t:CDS:2 [Funneliformis geosporum]
MSNVYKEILCLIFENCGSDLMEESLVFYKWRLEIYQYKRSFVLHYLLPCLYPTLEYQCKGVINEMVSIHPSSTSDQFYNFTAFLYGNAQC